MKKVLILLLGITLLIGCSTTKTEVKEDVITVPEQIDEKNHPLYSEFSFTLTETINENGYGKATTTNSSDYAVKYIKFNLEDGEGVENMVASSDSLLPGETSKDTVVFFSEGSLNINDYTPIWLEFNYLDGDKNEHIIRYDYKLDVYDEY